jgi:hypothetical protein
MRCTASGAAGNGLGTTIKYLRSTRNGAAGSGLGTTIKYLQQKTAGGNRLAATTKYRAECLCVDPKFISRGLKRNPHENTFPFTLAALYCINILF